MAIALGLGSFSFAQDDDVLTGKDGAAILPAAGDWALGFDAAPLLRFFIMDMFNGLIEIILWVNAWANGDFAITLI